MTDSFPQAYSIAISPLNKTYTYYPPAENKEVQIGWKVAIPFGRQKTTGYIISIVNKVSNSEFKIKNISDSDLNCQCFLESQLPFFEWMSSYYGEAISKILENAIPNKPLKKEKIILTLKDSSKKIKGKIQKQIFDILLDKQSINIDEVKHLSKSINNSIKSLEKQDVLEITKTEIIDRHITTAKPKTKNLTDLILNEEQSQCYEKIRNKIELKEFEPFLLHGVTGSGKTEIYIKSVEKALSLNLGALIIVPEIALTPQMIDRFSSYFGNELGILHSGIDKRVRWDSWRALLEGRSRVAIGARSAIFAPIPNLGLIIVDEEHDSSYKQSDRLRYNARDLAIVRAKLEKFPVVLGSATPSMESISNVIDKKYSYITLKSRFKKNKSFEIDIIDLKKIKTKEMKSKSVSPILYKEIEEAIKRKEQVFILYNKRGYARYLQCVKCGEVKKCNNCDITLTYYQKSNSLKCHYCGATSKPENYCTECGRTDSKENNGKITVPGKLIQIGSGTEKIDEELKELFPNVSIDRLDRDVAKKYDHYKDILDKVKNKETDILVGTQMIAKGHDLPGVNLVGVIDCDVGLSIPDFRSSERIFQLLTQVAGRAGRSGASSKVILQTRNPDHFCLRTTKEKNYKKFAEIELTIRKSLNFPPYSKLLRIVVSSEKQDDAYTQVNILKETLKLSKTFKDIFCLGPAPAPIGFLRNKWRWHLMLRSTSSKTLCETIKFLKDNVKAKRGVYIVFDMDPQEMM